MEAIIFTLKKQFFVEVISMSFNVFMIFSWILFRNIWNDEKTDQWSVQVRLILGYAVSLINTYMVVYFFKMFLFFYEMLSSGSIRAKLFFFFTLTLSFFTLMSIISLCIIIPTLNYFIPIEKQTNEMPRVLALR